MSSGNWFKAIISLRKSNDEVSKCVKGSSARRKSNSCQWRQSSGKDFSKFSKEFTSARPWLLGMPIEDIAAIQIQTAFRAYLARKYLRRLKGIVRLQILSRGHVARKQTSTTLNYLHSWSRVQDQIRSHRLSMVAENRIKQKKREDQSNLKAKFNGLEVEWSGGCETIEAVLAKINQREEAVVKRERALAYAFSHQWRANSNKSQQPVACELGNDNWGWSWVERWNASRPWERREPVMFISTVKAQNKSPSKAGKCVDTSTPRKSISEKPALFNGKARRLSYPAEKSAPKGNIKAEAE